MQLYDRGSAIIDEVEIQKYTPYGSEEDFDPQTHKITVIDPEGTEKVAAQDLTKSTTGKYLYKIQTEATWITGVYKVKIIITDTAGNDITVDENAFELK